MSKTKRILATLLAIVAVVCLISAVLLYLHYYKEDKQLESLSDSASVITEDNINETSPADSCSESTDTSDSETVSDSDIDTNIEEITETFQEELPPEPEPVEDPAIPNPYTESFLANEDMAGWLLVPGTVIDYPIMWTPEDEEYYLYKGFDKKKNSNGCLILDTDSCTNPLTTNLIIHGHNMKSGAMFGNLTDYESEEYFKEHSDVILHTKECQRNYKVIAVFYSQVYKKTDNVFKFYKFFQANTEEEFNDFYNNIKELSIYDTGVTAEFGDNFITLSTCAYHVDRGRFVVVAKEVEPGSNYLPIEEQTIIE